jgi:O-antigen ligase
MIAQLIWRRIEFKLLISIAIKCSQTLFHWVMNNKVATKRRETLVSPKQSDAMSIPLVLFVFLACVVPLVTAYQLPPQPAFINQWLAAALWSGSGLIALQSLGFQRVRFGAILRRRSLAARRFLLAFWALLLAAIALSVALAFTPWYIAVMSFAVIGLAALLTFAITRLDADNAAQLWRALLFGLLVAALLNASVALLQTFAPRWHDDVWIAQLQGDRAFGNLRQPNLLALLSLWGLVCAFTLFRKTMRWLGVACAVLLLAALWWSGSRAGWLGLPIVIACCMAQHVSAAHAKHEREQRTLVSRRRRVAIGLLIAVITLLLASVAAYVVFTQVERAVSLTQRISLWRDVWHIVRTHPWLGVGFGQLNFAWTLTALPARSPDVFDHAHNLLLHWAAEFGLITTTLLLGLIALSLTSALRSNRSPDRFAMLAIIAVALWQSLAEYPLWFAHFLLPTAVCAALLVRASDHAIDSHLAHGDTKRLNGVTRALIVLSALGIIAGLAWTMQGYRAVTAIYANANQLSKAQTAAANAQRHPIYGYFGDYAKIMLDGDSASLSLFSRAPRAIIDEKLLTAWARALERESRFEEAAYIIARAREFPPDRSFEQLPILSPESITPTSPVSSPGRVITLEDFRR